MVLPVSFVCQAEPWTGHFIIELEQNSGFPNPSFSIKRDQLTLSGNPPDITDTNDYAKSDSPPDDKRHIPDDYQVKTTLIESIFWQWLHAAKLLIAYELILTTRDAPPGSKRLPVEVVVAVGWLLKSYCPPCSPLFNPIKLQAVSMLKQDELPLAITITMPGYKHEQQGQPSESSDQQAPETPARPSGYFSSHLSSDYGDGNESPRQHQHTLDLNCFVHPCYGLCRFRPPSDSGALNSVESLICQIESALRQGPCPHFANKNCYRCNLMDGVASDGVALDGATSDGVAIKSMGAVATHTNASAGNAFCNMMVIKQDDPLQQCGMIRRNAKTLSDHKTIDHAGQQTCDMTLVSKNGQQRPCGKVFANPASLRVHKRGAHTGQQTCNVTVVGKNGQQRLCGVVLKNLQSLSSHKSRIHRGQQICDVTVVGKDGERRLCRKVCKNAGVLANHKRKHRKREPVNFEQEDDLCPPKGKKRK
ncbi:hypothetical protein [Endozoicomonas sp. ALB032]|uniref:hypothetical protein n=1 Tax=Endozoicomonas sp. ALB032 TaxID=3403082 RepID=UPI003BB78967